MHKKSSVPSRSSFISRFTTRKVYNTLHPGRFLLLVHGFGFCLPTLTSSQKKKRVPRLSSFNRFGSFRV